MSSLTHLLPSFSAIDSSFSNKQTKQYDLLMEFGYDGFRYALWDNKSAEFIALNDFEIPDLYHLNATNLENYLSDPAEFLFDYRSVKIGVNHIKYTLVPQVLFDENRLNEYLELQHLVNEDELIIHDKCHGLQAYIVYTIPKSILHATRIKFENCRFYHSAGVAIEGIISEKINGETATVFLDDKCFLIILFQKAKQSYCNSILLTCPEDVLYFVLNAFKQLGIDPHMQHLTLSCNHKDQSEIFELLRKYILHISYRARPDFIRVSKGLDAVKPHQYHKLFSLKLCV